MTPDLAAELPWVATAITVGLVFGMVAVRRRMVHGAPRDPRRVFSGAERALGFSRAGNQCEFARWVVFRCSRTAAHGDHFIPWSKGGATSMRNFVAACPACNLAKSAHTPGRLAAALVSSRRRRYFPEGVPRAVGERMRAVR